MLRYQEKFVDKLLSVMLEYPNVLYCISNETNESEHWSGYWARYILNKADEAGRERGFAGAGLGPLAQTHLRSARMFTDAFDIFGAEPTLEYVSNREDDEAYLTAIPGEQYAIYFKDGGSVDLDLSHTQGTFRLRWMNILESKWTESSQVTAGDPIQLTVPGEGPWAALIVSQ